MPEAGERRPPHGVTAHPTRRPPEPWSAVRATLMACGAGLLAAVGWAILRSVFDVTVGSLVVAGLGGWGIGAALRRTAASPVVALLVSVGAWLAALLFAWFLAMAVLPASDRSLAERLAATPFTDWLAPQLGIIEIGALVVAGAASLYAMGAGRRAER